MPGKKKAEKRPDPPTQRIDELRGFLDAIESKVGTRPKNVIVGKAYFGDLLVEFCEGLKGRDSICGVYPIPSGLEICPWFRRQYLRNL